MKGSIKAVHFLQTANMFSVCLHQNFNTLNDNCQATGLVLGKNMSCFSRVLFYGGMDDLVAVPAR